MDTLTHLALGACLGEVLAGKQLGKKAWVIGAVAQVLPDADVLASLWLEPSANVLAHRGITHSFFIALMGSALLASAFHKWYPSRQTFLFWFTLLGVQLFVHDFIDGFNAYGTAWFAPFSDYRVSWHTIFVADPLFSIPLGIAVLVLILKPLQDAIRFRWALSALLISVGYLSYCALNKYQINQEVRRALAQQYIPYDQYFTTPTPFNNWLWYVVTADENGSYVGYRSVADQQPMTFQFFPKNDSLLSSRKSAEVARLMKFSQGYYTVAQRSDTLIFNDLRFGQMIGWQNPTAGFVFHYYLSPPLDNTLVLQRGRFKDWNIESMKSFIQRMRGI